MVVTEQNIIDLLRKTFDSNEDKIIVKDVSAGCGAKFEIIIGSDKFEPKPLLERQRYIYELLGTLMNDIHSVSMKTWTLTQYNKNIDKIQQQ
eukprot:gene5430-6774_t